MKQYDPYAYLSALSSRHLEDIRINLKSNAPQIGTINAIQAGRQESLQRWATNKLGAKE